MLSVRKTDQGRIVYMINGQQPDPHLSTASGDEGKITMGRNLQKRNDGVTLIEVMVAALAIAVVVIGAMQFQYFCALDAHKADVRAKAIRLGLLLLDGWENVKGDILYNPIVDFGELPLDVIGTADPGIPGLTNSFGDKCYRLKVDGAYYFVKLSYEDIDFGDPPGILRKLNVAVAWSRPYNSVTLEFHSRRLVRATKYATYVPLPLGP